MTRSSLSVTYFAFTALHFVCFALAITVCGLYGTDLQRAKKFDDYTNSKWVRKCQLRHTSEDFDGEFMHEARCAAVQFHQWIVTENRIQKEDHKAKES